MPPQLRGLLTTQLKKDFILATGLAVLSGLGYQFGIRRPTQQHYTEFYKTYDDWDDYYRMAAAGVFNCIKPASMMSEDDE